MTPDAATLAAIADELGRKGPMETTWRPSSVFQFAALLQLALRHPALHDDSDARVTADRFLQAVREYFADCPTTIAVIRLGDDPEHDV